MKQIFKISLVLFVSLSALFSAEVKTGTLTTIVFKDEVPLAGSIITVDGSKHYTTDSDGAVKTTLSAGQHSLEIVGKGAKKENLGYFKKSILVKESRDTQVISTFTTRGKTPLVSVDTPVGTLTQAKTVQAVAVTGKGRLNGLILSSEGKTPISGARVFVKGTAVDARTDANGRFSVEVPSGVPLSISVVHTAYSAQTIGGVQVAKDGSTSRTVSLTPASMELEEFVVLAPKIEGSLSEVIAEEKNTNSITNIIGAEAIAKKGDSSAASALKRSSGITLIGSKVYVRGLGDRYGNIELNSMPLPGPSPLKRLVPLDTFPSGVIGSLNVQKSGEASIPASFGGAYIDIITRSQVAKDYIKGSFEVGGSSYTGDKVPTQNGSTDDILGFNQGYWDRPSLELSGAEFNDQYFQRDFTTPSEALPANFKFQLEGAREFEINDDNKLTLIGNYQYEQNNNFVELNQFTQDIRGEVVGVDTTVNPPVFILGPLELVPLTATNTKTTHSTVSHVGLVDLGYNFADVFGVHYTKLYTHQADKNTVLRTIDDIAGADQTSYTSYLRWIETTLDVDQINGNMKYEALDLDSELKFGAENASSVYENPNTLEYIFEECDAGQIAQGLCPTGRQLPPVTSNLETRTEKSEDVQKAFYLSNITKAPFLLSEDDYIDIGYSGSSKTRVFTSEPGRFIERGEVQGVSTDADGNVIGDITTLLNTYASGLSYALTPLNNSANINANVDENSLYAKYFTKPFEKVEVIAGVRYTDVTQETQTLDPNNPVNNTLDTITKSDYFPSASVRYSHTKDNIVDVAVSQTFILPDLVEFANAVIVAPTAKRIDIVGNPDLVPTDITTVDLKYSHYLSDGEYLKAGAFYKDLTNPIEDAENKSASDEVAVYTFINSESASIYGLELDGRVGFERMTNLVSDTSTDWLHDIYLSGNFTLLESQVTLTPEQALIYTTADRGLQGLSPYIVNLALEYQDEDRLITLLYNIQGERLRLIGFKNAPSENELLGIPDTYEIPPHVVDLVWKETVYEDVDVTLKLGNLLDDETVWYRFGGSLLQGEGTSRDYARENLISDRFKTGRVYRLGISYKY